MCDFFLRMNMNPKKSPVKLHLKHGGLGDYSVFQAARTRRIALGKVIKSGSATYAQVIRRLNVLAIFNKNKYPERTELIRQDMDYLRQKYKISLDK